MERALVEDLTRLRKGRGIHDPVTILSLGDALRAACGLSEGMPPVEAYKRVRSVLATAIDRLPGEMAILARMVYGLDETAPPDSLGRRIYHASMATGMSQRTVHRRLQTITEILARHLTELAEQGWAAEVGLENTLQPVRALVHQGSIAPRSEANQWQAGVVLQLIKSLDNIESAAIQLGSILVVKFDGKIIARSLSSSESSYLTENPSMLTRPSTLLDALQAVSFAPRAP